MSIESSDYQLTRRAFLDAIWNRLDVVQFHTDTWPTGVTYKFENAPLDRFNRPKFYMRLSSKRSPRSQAITLAHEITHIDRDSWTRQFINSVNFYSWDSYFEEEKQTDIAARLFFHQNPKLVYLALGYVWRHRQKSIDDSIQLRMKLS